MNRDHPFSGGIFSVSEMLLGTEADTGNAPEGSHEWWRRKYVAFLVNMLDATLRAPGTFPGSGGFGGGAVRNASVDYGFITLRNPDGTELFNEVVEQFIGTKGLSSIMSGGPKFIHKEQTDRSYRSRVEMSSVGDVVAFGWLEGVRPIVSNRFRFMFPLASSHPGSSETLLYVDGLMLPNGRFVAYIPCRTLAEVASLPLVVEAEFGSEDRTYYFPLPLLDKELFERNLLTSWIKYAKDEFELEYKGGIVPNEWQGFPFGKARVMSYLEEKRLLESVRSVARIDAILKTGLSSDQFPASYASVFGDKPLLVDSADGRHGSTLQPSELENHPEVLRFLKGYSSEVERLEDEIGIR
jgi:hypothetical protein